MSDSPPLKQFINWPSARAPECRVGRPDVETPPYPRLSRGYTFRLDRTCLKGQTVEAPIAIHTPEWTHMYQAQ